MKGGRGREKGKRKRRAEEGQRKVGEGWGEEKLSRERRNEGSA